MILPWCGLFEKNPEDESNLAAVDRSHNKLRDSISSSGGDGRKERWNAPAEGLL